ncbi:MAG: alpha/beta fold hydrolase [Gammaproteobacteria bacterium]|nr:MAG: alpha/beta fold hydrolase [Gammaproteobacteria bacterium]
MVRKSVLLLSVTALLSSCAVDGTKSTLTIAEQGNFSAGGSIVKNTGVFDGRKITSPEGQTLHGDHASVIYQIPDKARPYPLVFLHGAGQSASTWGTTPDGREGFQNYFLRKDFSVYLVDQPRRGRAGQSTVPAQLTATPQDQMWFNMFRIGQYPNYFENVQFSKNAESLNQYFRQMTPNTGPYDEQLISDSMVEALKHSGPSILITHSQGGGPGWWTAIKTEQVKAIVAYEPGSGFVFPDNELPEDMPSLTGTLKATPVKAEEFNKLTKIPIVIYYGDNIPTEASSNPGQDNWRVRLKMARLWADKINQHGGKASVVHLPEIGIYGNTHFPFSDLNNIQIAELMKKFLEENKLN